MNECIIIESPNKCKKIQEISGQKVIATVGHFKEMPARELAVDLANYAPTFRVSEGKQDIVQRMKSLAKGAKVWIATDPDREGYAIATDVFDEIRGVAAECWRLEMHEITAKGFEDAKKAARPWADTNQRQYAAFLGRRVTDRIVGYSVSPAASADLKQRGLSAGRVQSAALRLVVDREAEIRDFKPVPFWTLAAELAKDGITFKATHTAKRFDDKATAENIRAKIAGATLASVGKIERTEAKRSPAAPFSTATLQVTANARLGLPTEEVMSLAQRLFEAGLITYHRTDSFRLADEFVSEVRAWLEKNHPSALPEKPRVYKSKNSQAEAHEAIRPTHMHDLAEIPALMAREGLTARHGDLYRLIFIRAVASQMSPAVYDKTAVALDLAGEPFAASGRVLRDPGFLALDSGAALEDDEEDKKEGGGALPRMEEGDNAEVTAVALNEGKTKPPSRYTEGSIVTKLEELGIGRPSTYAQTINTIKKRQYVSLGTTGKEKGKILPTETGVKLIAYLKKEFAWLVDYELTRSLEDQLDQVEAGELEWQAVVRSYHERMGFLDPSKIARPEGGFKPRPEDVIGACPLCKGQVVARERFYGCINWKKEGGCPFKIWKDVAGAKVSPTDAKALLAGKSTKPKKCKSKAGKTFEAKFKLSAEGRIEFEFPK